jgi:two-component system chemotaxis sensor kinase CheA
MLNQEYIEDFVEEVVKHISNIETLFLKKFNEDDDGETIGELFRAVHSIKGTAGLMGLVPIVTLSHAMENVVSKMRKGELSLSNTDVDTMLAANDCLKDLVENVEICENRDVSPFISRVERILSAEKNGSIAKLKEKDAVKTTLQILGNTCDILKKSLQNGHRLYGLRINMNTDIINNSPFQLFKKIQTVGYFIDTFMDHSEINSLEDVMDAGSQGNKDVYLDISFSSMLSKSLLASSLSISETAIYEMIITQAVLQKR